MASMNDQGLRGIAIYGERTHVLCKVCKQRKIFVEGETAVSVRGPVRYLTLQCPSPGCMRIVVYEENELEIH
jgi:hypothetical protein